MPKNLILTSIGVLLLFSCKKESSIDAETNFATEIGYSVSVLQSQVPSLLAYSMHQENDLYPIYFSPTYLDSTTADGDGTLWQVESKNYLERRDFIKSIGKSTFYGTNLTGLVQDTVKVYWSKKDSFFIESHSGKNQLVGQLELIHKGGLNFTVQSNLEIISPSFRSTVKGSLSLEIQPENFDLNFLSGREYSGSLLYSTNGTDYLVDLDKCKQHNGGNTLANTGTINMYKGIDFRGTMELDPFNNTAFDFVVRFKKKGLQRIKNCW